MVEREQGNTLSLLLLYACLVLEKTKDTMSKKNALCTLSALILSAVAGFGIVATPVVAVAEHHEESGEHKCSGEKKEEGEKKCNGEKKCSGDKAHDDPAKH